MDKFLGSRIGRKRLCRPAWWYHKCSVPGCTIPLWPADENIDEDGYEMRGIELMSKHISFSQICFLCSKVLCRYHLSAPIDFAERWSYDFQQDSFHPPVARLCSKCILDVEIEYIVWLNEELLPADTLEKKYRRSKKSL